jgi:hypothetical protein
LHKVQIKVLEGELKGVKNSLGYRNSLDALTEESPSKISDKVMNKLNTDSTSLIKVEKKNELPLIVTSEN